MAGLCKLIKLIVPTDATDHVCIMVYINQTFTMLCNSMLSFSLSRSVLYSVEYCQYCSKNCDILGCNKVFAPKLGMNGKLMIRLIKFNALPGFM